MHDAARFTLATFLAAAALAPGTATKTLAESAWAPSAGTEACRLARPHAAGLSEHRIESDGRIRRFLLYVPRSYTGATAVPLVFDLQASGISPEVELQITGMEQAAEARGFIVVAPEAITDFPRGGTTWNIPHKQSGVDDVAFIGEVLEAVNEAVCVDKTSVYAVGFSGGARFASELACRMPDRFAAISAVGGLRHPVGSEGQCQSDTHAVSIIAFHSVDDPVNPYDPDTAKSPPYWTYSVEEAVNRWADGMACSAHGQERLSDAVRKLTYSQCRDGAMVALYRLSGSGHTWPGSSFRFPDGLGATDAATDATTLSLHFFEQFRLARDQ